MLVVTNLLTLLSVISLQKDMHVVSGCSYNEPHFSSGAPNEHCILELTSERGNVDGFNEHKVSK